MSNIPEKKAHIFKKYIMLINSFKQIEHLRLLDIGCANGVFIDLVNQQQNKCYGIDIDAEAVSNYKRNQRSDNKVEVCDINAATNDFPFKNTGFDVITCFDVIEHLFNFNNLGLIIRNNLKNDGLFVITTPNANALEKLFNKNYSGEYDKSHKILFTPYTLDFFLRRMGLKKVILFTPYIFMFTPNLFNKK